MTRKVKEKLDTVIDRPIINGSFAVERTIAKSVAYTSSIVGVGPSDQNIVYPDPPVSVLFHHTTHNNTLLQCISCMEVNIDGTGFTLLNTDGSEADKNDPVYKDVVGFFSEVYPQTSFISLRRTLRANQESVGWSGMEILRSLDGKLKFLRAIDVCKFFYLTLPPPMQGTLTVTRNGKVTSVSSPVRPRGMVSIDEGVKQYHSIYGSGLYIDRETGEWGANIPQARRGTEIVIFGAIDNPFSPYHTPRWINQSPSVTGSREAEQLNLEFFESGGIPPLLVTVSGGALGKKTKEALEKFLNTDKKKQYRAAVLETYATGGSLEGSPGSVNVKVESFGSQQQRDSLFENYDAKCEARIRSAFRLPPLLVGRAADFTYACYSEDTETLTDQGWITYDQYRTGMKIATVDPKSGLLQFRLPLVDKPLVYDIEDEIYHIKSNIVDIMVTKNHTMMYKVGTKGFTVTPIEQMLEHRRCCLLAAPLGFTEGDFRSTFAVPEADSLGRPDSLVTYQIGSIPMDLFLSWLGCVITDGTIDCTNYTITIGGVKKIKRDLFGAIIPKIEARGFNVYQHARSKVGRVDYCVNHKGLSLWMREKCGTSSDDKRIPIEFMSLPAIQLKVLFDSLMACGSAHYTKSGCKSFSYSTISPTLAGQVQDIALRLGYGAKIVTTNPGQTRFGKHPQYRVLMTSRSHETCIATAKNVRKIPYKGKVYCFSVPNGIFVTRRNGAVAIQGNTAYASYVVAEAQVFQPERDEFDTIINATIMRELSDKYIFKSKPLWVMDISNQLKAIELSKDIADRGSLIDSVNKLVGLSMKVSEVSTILDNSDTQDVAI